MNRCFLSSVECIILCQRKDVLVRLNLNILSVPFIDFGLPSCLLNHFWCLRNTCSSWHSSYGSHRPWKWS